MVYDVQRSFWLLSVECMGVGVDKVRMLHRPPGKSWGYPAPAVSGAGGGKNRTGGQVPEVELTGHNEGLQMGPEGEREIEDNAKVFHLDNERDVQPVFE